MSDKVCGGCGRSEPSDEEVRLARAGLGAFIDDNCWGRIEGYEPCLAWQDDDGERYVTIATIRDMDVADRLHGPICEKLLAILRDLHPDTFARHTIADAYDEVLVRKGHTSTVSVRMNLWDLLKRDAKHALTQYAQGFVDGAEAMT